MNGTLKGVKWMKSRQLTRRLVYLIRLVRWRLSWTLATVCDHLYYISARCALRNEAKIPKGKCCDSCMNETFRRRISGNYSTFVHYPIASRMFILYCIACIRECGWRRPRLRRRRRMKQILNGERRRFLNVCQGKSVVVCRLSVVCLCPFGTVATRTPMCSTK